MKKLLQLFGLILLMSFISTGVSAQNGQGKKDEVANTKANAKNNGKSKGNHKDSSATDNGDDDGFDKEKHKSKKSNHRGGKGKTTKANMMKKKEKKKATAKEKSNNAHRSIENYQARIDKAQKKLDDKKLAGTITEEEAIKKQAKIDKAKAHLAKMKQHLADQDAKLKKID